MKGFLVMPRIPYIVSEHFFVNTFKRPERPWRPHPDLFLYEALELIGQKKYGDKWTGAELTARKLRNFPCGQNWGIKERNNYSPLGYNVQHKLKSPYYSVVTIGGSSEVQTYNEALSLWKDELPKLKKEYDAEMAARSRFEECVDYLRNILFQGNLSSHVIDKHTGRTFQIPTHHWGADKTPEIFEMGRDQKKWQTPNSTKFISGTYQANNNTNVVWTEGTVLVASNNLNQLFNERQKVTHNFSAPAGYTEHLNAYREYFLEQQNRFVNKEIEWPTISQVEEEKILRQRMLEKGQKLNRKLFQRARKACIENLPKTTKRSQAAIISLREKLSSESKQESQQES
jgi:hypothetical protein